LLTGGKADARAQAPQPFQISVNVDLVVLQATVHNRNGGFASDLNQSDFELYEDGVRQSIRLFRHEDSPVTVGLVVDHSTSMSSKLPEVIAAAQTFVAASRPDDQMFVVNFNEFVSTGPPDSPLTNRADLLTMAISSRPAIGMTALYDALLVGLERLKAGVPEKKVLVLISDGGDNASKHRLAEVLQKAEQSTALLYTIGIFDDVDPDSNPRVLSRLSSVTGGEAFFPQRLEEVVSICEHVAHEIRNQYTLAYVSNNAAKPGAFRTIRLVAHSAAGGKLIVRTRSGYIAAAQPGPARAEGTQ
jgi:VWFA-related protein